MIKGLHCHISDDKYGFRTELLSVMYLNSVTVFFPTLLTLLGNAWFLFVMLLTRQYRILLVAGLLQTITAEQEENGVGRTPHCEEAMWAVDRGSVILLSR